MAERLDVAERLAEGRPAVEHTQSYLRACQLLGYQDPELTSHPGQIRDWYDSEDGLDLHALDGDCAQLRATVAAVTEALRMQRAQVDERVTAWNASFLQRFQTRLLSRSNPTRGRAALFRPARSHPCQRQKWEHS